MAYTRVNPLGIKKIDFIKEITENLAQKSIVIIIKSKKLNLEKLNYWKIRKINGQIRHSIYKL